MTHTCNKCTTIYWIPHQLGSLQPGVSKYFLLEFKHMKSQSVILKVCMHTKVYYIILRVLDTYVTCTCMCLYIICYWYRQVCYGTIFVVCVCMCCTCVRACACVPCACARARARVCVCVCVCVCVSVSGWN